ncbi:MAG: spore maturation protein A [Clostridia bacterium]|nr:spore maturation protein A [Clostridia bacterium]
MLGKIFGVLSVAGLLFGMFTGNTEALGDAVLDGASRAVEVTLSLCGMMCLWCGMMRVLQEAGVIRGLSRLLSPFLRLFFPQAHRTGEGIEEISANVSANLLGIGNAATPFALAAMEKMQKSNPHPDRATSDQITLAVLNTASVTLIPANLLALRRAAGSERPYAVLVPVWICSVLSAAMALFLTSIPGWIKRGARRGEGDRRG